MTIARLQFANLIVETLANNPDWLPDALSAVSFGMDKALQQARHKGAQYDLAFRCALSLADPKRLNKDTKDLLNSSIVEAIGRATCPIEQDFLKRTSPQSIEEPSGDEVEASRPSAGMTQNPSPKDKDDA